MLTFAITTLFVLSFFGALSVIGYMFATYRGKIASVIRQELQLPSPEPLSGESVRTFRVRSTRITGTAIRPQRHSRRPAPLAAAA
ncbi:hypothetical protein SAMN02745824_2805 [Parasphingorhabdus marina DSM 22363]|uniref:Uncharacterized protein n=1 Tax=Parasphingorhabdus marina DSM 22363 TaxID=1123272 RepID=A0A1N6GF92_9SPHN|nr:hypothetical protein SAMN02745824_2805 [Parasphingorhabdus marina DSM 22363]